MKTNLLYVLALLAAGCTTKNENSALVLTRIVAGSTTGSGGACTIDSAGLEVDFPPVNFAEASVRVGLVVDNRLVNPNTVNQILRTDSTDFIAKTAVVDYEIIGSSAAAPAEVTVPATGSPVKASISGVVVAPLVPVGTITGVAAGTYVRITTHVEGKLADGSSVKTSERSWIVVACTAPGCTTPACLQ